MRRAIVLLSVLGLAACETPMAGGMTPDGATADSATLGSTVVN